MKLCDDLAQEILNAYDMPVMTNIRRADYIEAIVAMTLRSEGWTRNTPWSSWDFHHNDTGCRMELKQSAARQHWGPSMSPARFDIAPRTGYWDEAGDWHDDPGRHADVYVFAWHPEPGPSADQREPMSWRFYVVPECELPPNQKTIGLEDVRRLVKKCDRPKKCHSPKKRDRPEKCAWPESCDMTCLAEALNPSAVVAAAKRRSS